MAQLTEQVQPVAVAQHNANEPALVPEGGAAPWLHLLLLWAAWAAIILGFQKAVTDRFQPARPDRAVFRTATESTRLAQNDKPFPLYPYLMRLPYAALRWLDLSLPSAVPLAEASPIATLTLSGVLISLLGTLGGVFALWDLARDELQDQGALRAVFYLLIFPTGFFLAQVYTEGLFVGLAFGCLALLRRRQWLWAALLAVLATWTRPVGVALTLALGVAWLQTRPWQRPLNGRQAALPALVLAPAAAHLVWRQSALGQAFAAVSGGFFGRRFIDLRASLLSWDGAWQAMLSENTQARIYYAVEFGAVGLALAACLFTLRRHPGAALFGLLALAVVVLSGSAQSMSRYVLVIPSNYIFLGRLGRQPVFDRAWTLASVLLLGMSAALFSWDMWVG
jgi:hypothetical protein